MVGHRRQTLVFASDANHCGAKMEECLHIFPQLRDGFSSFIEFHKYVPA